MVEAVFFISLVIIGITQYIKDLSPKVKGLITLPVAVAVGVVIALVDGFIGVTDINIAQGIVASLTAVGITTTANKVAGK